MPDVTYRIKLYGQSSGDPAFFLVELAAILEIDPEAARALLKSVPVVIKEGISKQEAEHLQDLLRVIKALSLMEPTEEIHETERELPNTQSDAQNLKQELDDKEQRETLRSYALVGVAAAVATIIVAWLLAGFFSSYSRTSAQNVAKPPIVESKSPEPPAATPTRPQAPNLSDLYKQKESAEFRVQQLEFQMQLAEQELRRLYSKYPNDPNSIREKKVEIAGYRERVLTEKASLKKLQTQVQAIEATLRQSSN
jgi:hypothetical protein